MNHQQFDSDDLLKKIISKDKLEQPSFDFTNKVMTKIQSPESAAVFVYKPAISCNVWIVIITALAVVSGILIFVPTANNNTDYNITQYLVPVQQTVLNYFTTGMQVISVLKSLSIIVVISVAGWLLLAADKIFLQRLSAH